MKVPMDRVVDEALKAGIRVVTRWEARVHLAGLRVRKHRLAAAERELTDAREALDAWRDHCGWKIRDVGERGAA